MRMLKASSYIIWHIWCTCHFPIAKMSCITGNIMNKLYLLNLKSLFSYYIPQPSVYMSLFPSKLVVCKVTQAQTAKVLL